MEKEKSTIRTSPTISKDAYDVYNKKGIRISHFLERRAMGLLKNNTMLNDEIWQEMKLKENQIKFYEEQKRILDKKIDKLKQSLGELREEFKTEIDKEVFYNIKNAQHEINTKIGEEREKRRKSDIENIHYTYQRIPIEDILKICEKHGISPKLVLPEIDSNTRESFIDNKCEKYCKKE